MATPKNSSVKKAFDILCAFSPRNGEMSASEVAAATGLNTATVHRFLLTLADLGVLARTHRNRYQLGLLLAELGDSVEHHKLLTDIARPHVEALAARFRESVRVALLNGNQVIYVVKEDPQRSLQIQTPTGTVPLYASAAGKVLLAGLPVMERAAMLAEIPLTRFTVRTKVALETLGSELDQVERQGFAIDDEEMEEGLRCVAVPIRERSGRVVAALSLSAPSSRLDWHRRDEFVGALSEHAEQIAAALHVDSRVVPGKAPPLGPFPHVKRVGDFVFVSGTSSRRPDQSFEGATVDVQGKVKLDVRAQTRATIRNVGDYLQGIGASLKDLVEMTVFLADIADYEEYNAAYAEFFDHEGPTRTTVAVNGLPHPHQLVMIKAVAYQPLG